MTDLIQDDDQKILWAIAALALVVTAILTLGHMTLHAIYYYHRGAQKQVLRIIFMPLVYAIASFLAFRYLKYFAPLDLVAGVWEAITVAAFLLLILELAMSIERKIELGRQDAIEKKIEEHVWWLCCCGNIHPSRPYFQPLIFLSVLQFVVVRPVIAMVTFYLEVKNEDCGTISVVLSALNAISALAALLGLMLFQHVLKHELTEKKPLRKVLSIKVLVGLVIIQTNAYYNAVEHGHAYEAALVVVEMVFFAAFITPDSRAFPKLEHYSEKKAGHTSPPAESVLRKPNGRYGYWRAVLDAANIVDFFWELGRSVRFFGRIALEKEKSFIQTHRLNKLHHAESGDKNPRHKKSG
ncbi:hypothetical protein TREMEDRAFT_58247 [Tremella mesenterica DSM 1558]|uniref:uncharacterized protein n=1 Tax=Tremella mesenterica (strain ATCC 24925 / CBS 8224 / DSM 1558 / NBRC 9311 / NRRL Y-6157 / RJB 2259-6 / UBC 559-6) TaxID=578456 RepID=UPI0003F49D46|nr:uncharacterized protein TREMEDRAFT_58247 [Tremella mesenterica DSM 1558]EIW72094.1 hypothetical protein TREMEDRAFT_58247 [Tremella mesenterica DSM 1558]